MARMGFAGQVSTSVALRLYELADIPPCGTRSAERAVDRMLGCQESGFLGPGFTGCAAQLYEGSDIPYGQ